MPSLKFTTECGADVSHKLNAVLNALESEISNVINPRDFGTGVFEILIGVICASEDLLSAGFFRTRRPRLLKAKRIVRFWDGRETVHEKCLFADISLSHSIVSKQMHAELHNYVIESIAETFSRMKKYDDFDQLGFVAMLRDLKQVV